MPNRLAAATSPYLQQHAENPVDWFEWGPEAFAEARRRDVPLLLSVGYAACHWCHVMAHESFEDDATAAQMNEHFVNVKVDREERPDVDAVYMEAVTATTGHGGWPMTVFADADGRPFLAGTYFPPRPAHGMPSFRQLLAAVAEAWATRREELTDRGQKIVDALSARREDALSDTPAATAEVSDAALALLEAEQDVANGGFGGTPKFPPSMTLEALLRVEARHRGALDLAGAGPAADGRALALARRALDGMARGGIYDQLAGGFARYAVDATWTVPHFEKMLYDNALLLRVYARAWRLTGDPLHRRVAEQTAAFLLRDLRTADGGFASSLDADTDGVEGLTYVWTPEQLVEVLGNDDAAWAARLLGVTPEGTFEHGSSVLEMRRDPDDPERWESVRSRLLAAREARPQPGRDDKVVAAWNGLAVAALADAGALLDRPRWVRAAEAAADLLLRLHLVAGRLRRVSRDGAVGRPEAVLEDLGDVAEGLLVLHQVTGRRRWLDAATDLLDDALTRFSDGRGGFADTADDAEPLVTRPRDPSDTATPSGWSATAHALLTAAALTGSTRYRDAAEVALRRLVPLVRQAPRFAGWAHAGLEALLAGPAEVAVVGPADDPARHALERTARHSAAPGAVVVVGEPQQPDVPLLADRPLVDGRAAAYVCRGFVCERPDTEPEALAHRLASR